MHVKPRLRDGSSRSLADCASEILNKRTRHEGDVRRNGQDVRRATLALARVTHRCSKAGKRPLKPGDVIGDDGRTKRLKRPTVPIAADHDPLHLRPEAPHHVAHHRLPTKPDQSLVEPAHTPALPACENEAEHAIEA